MELIQCEIPECNPPTEKIEHILKTYKKIAIVGLSPKKERDSNMVAKYLIKAGYEIIPVNPGQKEILGETCYKSLKEIPSDFDVVDIFLNPVRVPPVVDEAIETGAKVVWMQLGVIHNEAAEKAKSAGLEVVMNRCIKQEHENMATTDTL
jgi:predicted CoA-binding protein